MPSNNTHHNTPMQPSFSSLITHTSSNTIPCFSQAKYMPEDPEDPFKIFCFVTPLGSHTLESSITAGMPLNEADIWRYLLQSVAGIAHVHNTQQRGINGLTPSGMLVDKKGNVSLQSVSVQRAMRLGDCSEVHPSIVSLVPSCNHTCIHSISLIND
jgi:hypothetical protein